jgi:hypothetical protein
MKKLLVSAVFLALALVAVAAEDFAFSLQYVYRNDQPLDREAMAGYPGDLEIIGYSAQADVIRFRLTGAGQELQGELDVSSGRSFGPSARVYPISVPGDEQARLFYDPQIPGTIIVYTSFAILTFAYEGS